MREPYIGARERLRLSELTGVVSHRGSASAELSSLIPDRPWYLTTYGKSAFELAVVHAGLTGTRILMPGYISHDYVGVLQRHDITPVFADVHPTTIQLDPEACTADLLEQVSSLLILHSFGLPADGRTFRGLADTLGLVLIEDCARALGGVRDGHPVGWFGDYAAYSLSKVAPIVRGGLLSSREAIGYPLPEGHLTVGARLNAFMLLKIPGMRMVEGPLVRRLRDSTVYQTEVGLYEAPPIEGLDALGRHVLDAYMPHYRETIEIKRGHAHHLIRELAPLGFEFQEDTGGHLYTALGVRVPPGVDRDALVRHLTGRGVNAFTLWGDPLGTSEIARRLWGADPDDLPVTAMLAGQLVHLPVSRFLDDRDLERIVSACREFVGA